MLRRAVGSLRTEDQVRDALLDNPDLTLAQIRRWLAALYGLRLGEVEKVFRRLRRVYEEARTEALEIRRERQRASADRRIRPGQK